MIKTGRVEGKETGTLEMSGTLNDLMNDYNVIAKGMRKILVEKFGKEDGDKVFDILSSDKPRDGLREEVRSVIDEHLENEFKKSEPTELLKAFMNMFDKGKTLKMVRNMSLMPSFAESIYLAWERFPILPTYGLTIVMGKK